MLGHDSDSKLSFAQCIPRQVSTQISLTNTFPRSHAIQRLAIPCQVTIMTLPCHNFHWKLPFPDVPFQWKRSFYTSMPCESMPYHATQRSPIPCHWMSCCALPFYTILFHTMPGHDFFSAWPLPRDLTIPIHNGFFNWRPFRSIKCQAGSCSNLIENCFSKQQCQTHSFMQYEMQLHVILIHQ